MTDSTVESLLDLHMAFWKRELELPVVNIDCSAMRRLRDIPALPPEWEEQKSVVLEPDMLSPE